MFKKIICLILVVFLIFTCCSCKENKGKNLSSNKTLSYIEPPSTENNWVIDGNNVIYTSQTGDYKIKITYIYTNGALKKAHVEQQCTEEEMAKNVYDTCEGMNKYASQIMYENLKLAGKNISYDMTEFALQKYKGLTKEELKNALKNDTFTP